MESIDDLLSQLKAEYETPQQPKHSNYQQPLKEGQFHQQSPISPIPLEPVSLQNSSSITPSAAEYGLLAELKAEFTEQERAEELRKQQQLKEEQQRQERIKQQQRQALKKDAEAWLKKLNPRSAEGLWFEEFAYSYPSKLEAAIDYLQALKETQS